jgi:hypothetical protein
MLYFITRDPINRLWWSFCIARLVWFTLLMREHNKLAFTDSESEGDRQQGDQQCYVPHLRGRYSVCVILHDSELRNCCTAARRDGGSVFGAIGQRHSRTFLWTLPRPRQTVSVGNVNIPLEHSVCASHPRSPRVFRIDGFNILCIFLLLNFNLFSKIREGELGGGLPVIVGDICGRYK